jgi:hypothetical protein
MDTLFNDGEIAPGFFTSTEWCIKDDDSRLLIRRYIGTKSCGPMLQYDAEGRDKYNGIDYVDMAHGAWTNCYSRGNFGRNYACGGTWSGHTKNLHPRLMLSPIVDVVEQLMWLRDDLIELPEYLQGDIKKTDIDCSGSWSIFYPRASQALHSRLTALEMLDSTLPTITKNFLCDNQTIDVMAALESIINKYEL